jgi:hypothetical protein
MEEARAVLERLARIDALERGGATSLQLLAELRALVVEAEAWVRVEPPASGPAADALERCRLALGGSRRPP